MAKTKKFIFREGVRRIQPKPARPHSTLNYTRKIKHKKVTDNDSN